MAIRKNLKGKNQKNRSSILQCVKCKTLLPSKVSRDFVINCNAANVILDMYLETKDAVEAGAVALE